MKTERRRISPKYAAREILPKRLLNAAAKANSIRAASPYVTDTRLFSESVAESRKLYTDFNAMSFISGASSLTKLASLLKSKVSLYHIPDLHAKVVLIDDLHFALGSQNLTYKGRRNVEANVISGSETPAQEVADFFDRIHKIAVVITLGDIQEMERLIEPFMAKFKELEKSAEKVDAGIDDLRRQRVEVVKRALRAKLEENRRKFLEENRMRRTVKILSDVLANQKDKRSKTIVASVHRLTNYSDMDYGAFDSHTQSLVPRGKEDFLELVSAIGLKPRRLERYLLIDKDNGKLGLVRIAKTRLTYFGSGVSPVQTLIFGNQTFRTQISFEWNKSKLSIRNGKAKLGYYEKSGGRFITTGSVDFAFSLAGLELFNPKAPIDKQALFHMAKPAEMQGILLSNELRDFLIRQLTNPFKFKENLYGNNALEFFGRSHPSMFEICAQRFGDTAILIASKYP